MLENMPKEETEELLKGLSEIASKLKDVPPEEAEKLLEGLLD